MEKCYKFRIYPSLEQQNLIQRTFGCTRFVYNHYLAQRISAYECEKISLTQYTQCKDLTQLKKVLEWLREVDATALQSALKNLDTAYQGFFRRVKRGEKPGFPKFKSKHSHQKSYRSICVGKNIVVQDEGIKLPKLGIVSAAISNQPEGRILSATVSQNPSGKYFVSICCTEVDIAQHPSTGAVVGIDMGIRHLCTTSDGVKFDNHKYLAKAQKKLARLQRQLSRKTKGSKNRGKARLRVAKLHEHVANQRNDTLHKLTTALIKQYDIICIEDLHIKDMMKDRRFSQLIHDAAWGEFVRQLTYKSQWQHKQLVKVDSFYPSSQLCACCGFQNAMLKNPAIQEWDCPKCGTYRERHFNAAQNILTEGLRQLA